MAPTYIRLVALIAAIALSFWAGMVLGMEL